MGRTRATFQSTCLGSIYCQSKQWKEHVQLKLRQNLRYWDETIHAGTSINVSHATLPKLSHAEKNSFHRTFPLLLMMGPLGQYWFERKFPHTSSLTYSCEKNKLWVLCSSQSSHFHFYWFTLKTFPCAVSNYGTLQKPAFQWYQCTVLKGTVGKLLMHFDD